MNRDEMTLFLVQSFCPELREKPAIQWGAMASSSNRLLL